ncbi:MAG: PAAR domain-containing protein [Acinetobacter sp.]|nr:PAAR domain-containing protein [Acinetobacter sp.]
MIRYQIFENDVTTAGGIVQRHTGGGKSFVWHNRLASNIGDKIKCPKCGSVGYIEAAGMRRPFDNHKDIPALDGDLCICKCNPPPVLKNSQKTFIHNVAGGIVINIPKNPLNVSAPSLQQNLNNSLVDDRDQGNSYYKWWWGKLLSRKPETIAQEKNSFDTNFYAFHKEYTSSKKAIIYEIDPKAWESESALEEILERIQDSADVITYTLFKALNQLVDGQSRDVVVKAVGVGGNYARIATTKHWPHGRLLVNLHGTVTRLGKDKYGKFNFQFKGHAEILNDEYSWIEDATGYKNMLIKTMGTIVALKLGSKQPSAVYNPNPNYSIGLPVKYMRHYYFDYYKKGANPPKYEK